LVASQREALDASEKARRKLVAELARHRGKELYDSTTPVASGFRRVVRRMASGAIDDELRALAQGFTSRSQAVFLAVIEDPLTMLLAVSTDAGIHAGNKLRGALASAGGRGGGNAQVAQGTVPSKDALESVLSLL
jgi:alanyl-tRNA synthetase